MLVNLINFDFMLNEQINRSVNVLVWEPKWCLISQVPWILSCNYKHAFTTHSFLSWGDISLCNKMWVTPLDPSAHRSIQDHLTPVCLFLFFWSPPLAHPLPFSAALFM